MYMSFEEARIDITAAYKRKRLDPLPVASGDLKVWVPVNQPNPEPVERVWASRPVPIPWDPTAVDCRRPGCAEPALHDSLHCRLHDTRTT